LGGTHTLGRSDIRGRKIKKPRLSDKEAILARLLSKLFMAIIEQDKKLEIRREVLAEIAGFEPFSVY